MKIKYYVTLLKATPSDFLATQQQARAFIQLEVEESMNLFSPKTIPQFFGHMTKVQKPLLFEDISIFLPSLILTFHFSNQTSCWILIT